MHIVRGFTNQQELMDHFEDHKDDFGSTTPDEYLAEAKLFFELSLPENPDLEEYQRADYCFIRFDNVREYFGVITDRGVIVTFFIPLPRWKAGADVPFYKTHSFRTNYEYFVHTASE